MSDPFTVRITITDHGHVAEHTRTFPSDPTATDLVELFYSLLLAYGFDAEAVKGLFAEVGERS